MSAGRLQTETCWLLLLVSPAHYKHVWQMWKVKAVEKVWSFSCLLWEETPRKCSFHIITFNFYWEATFKGIGITPGRDIFNWSLFSFNEDIHKADPFSFNGPSESCDLSPLGSQSPAAATAVPPVYQTSRCSVPTLDQNPQKTCSDMFSRFKFEVQEQETRWITSQDSWQESV